MAAIAKVGETNVVASAAAAEINVLRRVKSSEWLVMLPSTKEQFLVQSTPRFSDEELLPSIIHSNNCTNCRDFIAFLTTTMRDIRERIKPFWKGTSLGSAAQFQPWLRAVHHLF